MELKHKPLKQSGRWRLICRSAVTFVCGGLAQLALAQDNAPADTGQAANWAVHGQLTNITQGNNLFRSPYSGDNSLKADSRTEETTDITLFAGYRLAANTELWINPEIDQGFGLSNTLGMAGYPSGGAYKLGENQPYVRLPRLFLRHVVALGGESVDVEGAANQLAGKRAQQNLTFTVGKFSVADIFDNNQYAHDPRGDFLNWSVIEAGAFDYAADVWGYTNGATVEWNRADNALRAGLFQLSPAPNSKIAGVHRGHYSLVLEAEQNLDWNGHPGKLRLLGFANRAPMSSYQDALALAARTGAVPDVALTRKLATNTGVALNWEQEVCQDVGMFGRISKNRGDKEAYEFTDINQSLSAGAVIKGSSWQRPDDKVGIAAVVNSLSDDARRYFAAGGLGVLIGDGRLNYGDEKILEAYYAFRAHRMLTISVDYQRVINPAYNRDRGPVSLLGVRLHGEF